jgi:hypothetical protein
LRYDSAEKQRQTLDFSGTARALISVGKALISNWERSLLDSAVAEDNQPRVVVGNGPGFAHSMLGGAG